ncbi:MAG: efflux RND transporter permease subunit [Pseudolabrys sp.]
MLRVFEAMFNSWHRAYERTLDLVLKYKSITLMVTLATMVGTVWLYVVIPKGFFPVEDTGFISATVEGPARYFVPRHDGAADRDRQYHPAPTARWTTSIRPSALGARTRPIIPAASLSV